MSITIFEYKPENLEDLKRLINELGDALKELEPEIVASGNNVLDSYVESLLNNVKAKRGVIYLAFNQNKAVGAAVSYVKHEEDEIVDYLYLSDLVVTKSEQGRGIGTLLLDRIEKYARENGLKYMRLQSYVKNEGALRLYKRAGFENFLSVLQKILN